MFFVFIYAYWCPTLFRFKMTFVSLNSNTTGVICGVGTANYSGVLAFILVFSVLRVARS